MRCEYCIVYKVHREDDKFVLCCVDRHMPCRYTSTIKHILFDEFDKIVEYAKRIGHNDEVFVVLVNNEGGIEKSVKVS